MDKHKVPLLVALAAVLAALLAGCVSSPEHTGASGSPAVSTVGPATAAASPAPPTGRAPDVCRKFRALLPKVAAALAHKDIAVLNRAGQKIARWSHTVVTTTNDAQFARHLSAVGVELTVVASAAGATYVHRATVDMGKVNGYCKST
jgi:type IV pilus biogenesis protein CpaD/CtpE